MSRTVFCEYERRDTEGLDFVPWPGELGKRVFAHIGKAGWAAWLAPFPTMTRRPTRC